MSYEILVDWSGTGVFHRNAKKGDPINMFGAVSANIQNMYARAVGTGGALSNFDNELDGRGLSYLVWESGTTANASVEIGYNGTLYNLPSTASGNYTGVLWVYSTTPTQDNVELQLRVRSTGTIFGTSPTFKVLSGRWQQVSVRATLTGTPNVYLELRKSNAADTTVRGYRIISPMLVMGSSAPEGFNSGAASTCENLTPFLKTARWNQGFTRPYQFFAGVGKASITLKSDDGLFAPERTTSPVYGYMKPSRNVLIYGYDIYANRTLMWQGFIENINASVSGRLAQTIINCHDRRKLADGKKVVVDVETSIGAEYLARLVVYNLQLPNPMDGIPLPDIPPSDSPEDYEEIYPFAPDAASGDAIDAVRMIGDCAGATLAKAWFQGRTFGGPFEFYHGIELGGSVGALVLDGSRLQAGNYQYGAQMINESVVVARKRKVSAATNKILYETDEAISLTPNEELTISARYKDVALESDKTVSGLDVYLETSADAGVTVTLGEKTPTTAEILIVNTTALNKNVASVKVRGKKLSSFAETEHRYIDSDSQYEYGVRAELLDFKLNTDMKRAGRMAKHRVMQFGYPFGEFLSVEVKKKRGDSELDAALVSLTMGSKVRIQDDATGHDGYYIVVGEQHEIASEIEGPTVTWYVEKQFPTFRLDDPVFGLLDGSNYLYWA